MDRTGIVSQLQNPVQVQSKIASLMHRCGVRKHHGHSVRFLTLATDRLKQLGTFCEKTAAAFFDAIINSALHCVGFSKNKLAIA